MNGLPDTAGALMPPMVTVADTLDPGMADIHTTAQLVVVGMKSVQLPLGAAWWLIPAPVA